MADVPGARRAAEPRCARRRARSRRASALHRRVRQWAARDLAAPRARRMGARRRGGRGRRGDRPALQAGCARLDLRRRRTQAAAWHRARAHAQPRGGLRAAAGSDVAVTVLIGAALVLLIVYFARHAAQPLLWLPTGMLLGGALGNIVDRLRGGSVTDFIKLPLGWPPFNLADTSIVLGVALCCWSSITGAIVSRERAVLDRLRGRAPAGRRQGAGRRRASRRGHPQGTLAQLLAGRAGGGDSSAPASCTGWIATRRGYWSSRAPRRPTGCWWRRSRAARSSANTSRSCRGARPRARGRSRRRSAAIAGCARGWPCAPRTSRTAGARRARTSSWSARSPTPHFCGCVWRRGARIRSACTCRRSAIRCAAIASMGRAASSAWSASSCTPRDWPSTIRSAAGESTSARRCLPISPRRSRGRTGLAALVRLSCGLAFNLRPVR